MAVVARDALPPGTMHERYEIVHASRLSVGVTASASQRCVFTLEKRPAPAPR